MRTTKVWPQHQRAITLLGGLLATPNTAELDWLDLACGKGQIIAQFEKNVPDSDLRRKIAYHAFDIENEHTRMAEKLAHKLGFRTVDVQVGEIEHFAKIFPLEGGN